MPVNNKLDFNSSFSEERRHISFIDIDLSTARTNEEIEIPGAVHVWGEPTAFDDKTTVSSTLSVGYCFIRFDNTESAPQYFPKLRNIKMDNDSPISKIYVTNPAQSGKMIRIGYSSTTQNDVQDNDVSVIGDNPAGSVVSNPAADIDTTARVLLTTNSDRKSYEIQNLDSTLDLVLLGTDSGGTASEGLILEPYQTYTGYETGAIYGITASGTIAKENIRCKDNA